MDAALRGVAGVVVALAAAAAARGQLVNQMPWDGVNGLLSVDDGRGGIARSADDFVIAGGAGETFEVTRLRGVILIDDVPQWLGARFEVYEDDGAGFPMLTPLHVFEVNSWTDLGLVAFDPAYRAYEVSAGDGVAVLFEQEAGVRRWVCLVGEHQLPFPSGRYFATFDEAAPAEGLGARMRMGDEPWRSSGCCVAPETDLAFAVEGTASAVNTSCSADADGSGELDVPDVFVFLSWWFAGISAADFDGVNGVGVSDVFAFLGAWFAGC